MNTNVTVCCDIEPFTVHYTDSDGARHSMDLGAETEADAKSEAADLLNVNEGDIEVIYE